ncbi:MAG: biopolymer transporter ExbD [bacterium]
MAGHSIEDDEPIAGINVTPLVDVCLVLVIIFMVTAPLLSEPVFKVKLPAARTQEGEEREKIVISISAEGKLALNEKEFKSSKDLSGPLKRALAASDAKYVIFRADAEAMHGTLTDLMYEAKESGAINMTIATEQKKGENAGR